MNDLRSTETRAGTSSRSALMTFVVDGVLAGLRVDFCQASAELAEARGRQHQKDTPANRVAVADCLARLDGVLDMYLEAEDSRR
jgi:hypothetical protein